MEQLVLVGVALVGLLACLEFWGWSQDKKNWNNGICAKYGEPWVWFDTDSTGARGYKCRDQMFWVAKQVSK